MPGSSAHGKPTIGTRTLEWMVDFDPKEDVNMDLNGEYRATITRNVVKVGCQEISHDVVKKLAEAIDEYNKD